MSEYTRVSISASGDVLLLSKITAARRIWPEAEADNA